MVGARTHARARERQERQLCRLGCLECADTENGISRAVEPDVAREQLCCLDIECHLGADEFVEIAYRDWIEVHLDDILLKDWTCMSTLSAR